MSTTCKRSRIPGRRPQVQPMPCLLFIGIIRIGLIGRVAKRRIRDTALPHKTMLPTMHILLFVRILPMSMPMTMSMPLHIMIELVDTAIAMAMDLLLLHHAEKFNISHRGGTRGFPRLGRGGGVGERIPIVELLSGLEEGVGVVVKGVGGAGVRVDMDVGLAVVGDGGAVVGGRVGVASSAGGASAVARDRFGVFAECVRHLEFRIRILIRVCLFVCGFRGR